MSEPVDHTLRALWQDAPQAHPTPTIEDIEARARAFHARLFWRNLREYVACGVVFCVFAAYVFIFPTLPCQVGAALTCAASVFVAAILAWRGHPRETGMGEDCQAFYVHELQRQRDLLKWVWLWYVAPFVPGLVLFTLGRAQGVPASRQGGVYLVLVAFAVVCIAAIWLNLRAARHIEQKLQDLIVPNGDQ